MAAVEWDELTLGVDSDHRSVERIADRRAAAAALAGQARRCLDILSPDLEASVYDHDAFLDAVRRLATRSPRTRIRCLVLDSHRAVRRGHRLIELARQLTSAIDLHRPGGAGEPPREAFLLADDRGFIHRVTADTAEALIGFNDPLRVRALRGRFDALWEESTPDPEMRRLHL